MPYVMVPVPEEHEAEITHEILRLTLRAALSDWTPESMDRVWDQLTPDAQTMVLHIARLNVDGVSFAVPDADVGEVLGLSPDEAADLATGVNETCAGLSSPALVLIDSGSGSTVDGGRPNRTLVMGGSPARLILQLVGRASDAP